VVTEYSYIVWLQSVVTEYGYRVWLHNMVTECGYSCVVTECGCKSQSVILHGTSVILISLSSNLSVGIYMGIPRKNWKEDYSQTSSKL